ncbi:MAG: hypothetical protein OYH77_03875 [Pseudomonadota bacterium]|nr:hypothetical protein [Pseudomonadota bacterium]
MPAALPDTGVDNRVGAGHAVSVAHLLSGNLYGVITAQSGLFASTSSSGHLVLRAGV